MNINAQNIFGKTPLICAAKFGHIDIVDLLLQKGADLYIEDAFHKNALDYAKEAGHEEIVYLLEVAMRIPHEGELIC